VDAPIRALEKDAPAWRWWWENLDTRECGLHVSAEAKV
jgi:hypothetical protein